MLSFSRSRSSCKFRPRRKNLRTKQLKGAYQSRPPTKLPIISPCQLTLHLLGGDPLTVYQKKHRKGQSNLPKTIGELSIFQLPPGTKPPSLKPALLVRLWLCRGLATTLAGYLKAYQPVTWFHQQLSNEKREPSCLGLSVYRGFLLHSYREFFRSHYKGSLLSPPASCKKKGRFFVLRLSWPKKM